MLRLSDAFEDVCETGCEWTATMIDINYGENADIVSRCRVLADYSRFVDRIRDYEKEMSLEDAIDHAVRYCIDNDILKQYLLKNRKEVKNMTLTEFNEERYGELCKKEGLVEGFEKGRIEGRVEEIIQIYDEIGLTKDEIVQKIAERLEVSSEQALELYDSYMETYTCSV